jgi:hopene-associated glycosyltransferase HpnB
MEAFLGVIAVLVLAAWLYLALARGWFWLGQERDDDAVTAVAAAPAVVAVVPARDEAQCIADSIGSLLTQSYPGPFAVILVDDQSSDGTAHRAEAAALAAGAADRLIVVRGEMPPPGWAGKVWAQHQGLAQVQALSEQPRYVWLTDADIVHAPDTLAWLVGQAEETGSVLVSLMAKLRCESIAERMLIPAFVFFFGMLYPFTWVNDAGRRTAGAAGGCMLVNFAALREAGGIAAIRTALIDDCALAQLLKPLGPIWLGLTERVQSIRAYPGFGDIARMVARSAYAQLNYSPLLLAGTVLGMVGVYVLPAVLALVTRGWPQFFGFASWLLMSAMFVPTLRFYDRPGTHGPLLPAIALTFAGFTVYSAIQHARGRGGLWKGRAQANLVGSP